MRDRILTAAPIVAVVLVCAWPFVARILACLAG